MFTPQPETMGETLVGVLLELFLGDKEENARQNTKPAIASESNKPMLPRFVDKLTLRLSVKIPMGVERARTQELDRTKSFLPEDKVRLRSVILSSNLWDLKVVSDNKKPKNWCWTLPGGGSFRSWRIDNENGIFRYHFQRVSRL
jgi:hypothetical protein